MGALSWMQLLRGGAQPHCGAATFIGSRKIRRLRFSYSCFLKRGLSSKNFSLMAVSFPNTRWSLVRRRESAPADARRAAEELCRLYWPPVYGYILSDGPRYRTPEEAKDLTQGFFLDCWQRGLFHHAEPSKGRLRSYLLGAVKHYLQSVERRNAARKRGGGLQFLPLNTEAEYALQAARAENSPLTPDEQFDRRWAECLLETCLAQLKEEYAGRGRLETYEALRPLLATADGPERHRLQAEAAISLGVKPQTLHVWWHRFLGRYRDLLAEEVRATLLPGMEASEELSYLARLLRKNGG